MAYKKKYLNTIKFFRTLKIRHKTRNLPILTCNCERQICRGKYIQTRPNQTECLFAIWEKEKIAENNHYALLSNIEMKKNEKIVVILNPETTDENIKGESTEHRENTESI